MTPALFDWFATRSILEWVAFSLLGNGVIFAISVWFCDWLGKRYSARPLFAARHPLSKQDARLAGVAVLLNSAVAVVGWWLWRAGWITITHPVWWRTILDVGIFLLLMDFAMYITHRIAHDPWFYTKIHATHHTHQSTNPISLFVLSPFEVFGFGALMISVLVVVPLSGAAILIYLFLNVLFGTLGHAGVEPFPRSWSKWILVRQIGTSTFHAEHHLQPRTNYGFYTVVWDRLFGTLHPRYDAVLAGKSEP